MSRYHTPAVDLLSKPAQSRRYEQVVRSLHQAQTNNGVFPEQFSLPKTVVPVEAWETQERFLHHETAGWVAAWRDHLPPAYRPQTYLGLTSSNLIDCARAMESNELASYLVRECREAIRAADSRAQKLGSAVREGRTHGQVAHPVLRQEVYLRFREELSRAMSFLHHPDIFGSLSGPTGNPDERILSHTIRHETAYLLGIQLDPHPTQLSSRIQYLGWYQSLYRLVAICEQLALHHRLESIAGVDRFQESFDQGTQRGSSSMPHKRNPARSERICGLARVARGHLQSLTEASSDMWWERDLSNSSTERVSYTGLVEVVSFVLSETADILRTARVSQEKVHIPESAYSSRMLVDRQLDGLDPDESYYQLQKELQDGEGTRAENL